MPLSADTPAVDPGFVVAVEWKGGTAGSARSGGRRTSGTAASGSSLNEITFFAGASDTRLLSETAIPQRALSASDRFGAEVDAVVRDEPSTLLEQLSQTRTYLVARLYAQASLTAEEAARLAIIEERMAAIQPRVSVGALTALSRAEEALTKEGAESDQEWDELGL